MGEPPPQVTADRRAGRRTNLLLTASIEFGGLTRQVRIRNVSESGALIEGPHVPKPGERLWLKRSGIDIGGTVAWASEGKAGVHFDGRLPVELWSGGKPKPTEPTGLRDQRRVDAVQKAIRAGLSISAYEENAAPPPTDVHLNTRISEEIKYVARLVESLGDQLAADPVILHKHAKSLQNIDLANQILSHLANLVTAEDPAARVAEIGMTDLRARLTRRSL